MESTDNESRAAFGEAPLQGLFKSLSFEQVLVASSGNLPPDKPKLNGNIQSYIICLVLSQACAKPAC